MNATNQVLAGVFCLAASAQAQQAVQWKVSEGGNGHWYQLRTDTGRRFWELASDAAAAGGYLVTLASGAENEFVRSISLGHYVHFGAFHDSTAASYSEPANGWRWVNGEPWNWAGWCPGQPDNAPWGGFTGQELARFNGSTVECWDDAHSVAQIATIAIEATMFEWSADCNEDGIVDFGQCRDGTLPDYNGNNTPDCCERGEACMVANYPVHWLNGDGRNGHWYQVAVDRTSFDSQRRIADARGAMLVCVSSAEENALVYRLARARGLPSVWLGMVQNPSGPEPDGGWHWIDGSNASWRNWGNGEPNNWQFDEDNCVMIVTPAPYDEAYWPTRWQDYPDFASIAAVVEWSADCNSDGIVDYGQILQGQLADLNGDGIPDICQPPTCASADLNDDATVNGADLGQLLFQWGAANAATTADINRDGQVDGADLGLLLSFWGPCTS